MTAGMDWHLARALLEWQVELGATEAIADVPIDRMSLAPEAADTRHAPRPAAAAPTAQAPVAAVPTPSGPDPVAVAQSMAAAAPDLPALAEALAQGKSLSDLAI